MFGWFKRKKKVPEKTTIVPEIRRPVVNSFTPSNVPAPQTVVYRDDSSDFLTNMIILDALSNHNHSHATPAREDNTTGSWEPTKTVERSYVQEDRTVDDSTRYVDDSPSYSSSDSSSDSSSSFD
jgi:hypothetical protein